MLLICPVNKCLQQPGPRGPLGPQGHHTHTHAPALSCRRLPAVFYVAWRLDLRHTHTHTYTHTPTIGRQNASRLLSTNNTSIHQPQCIGPAHKQGMCALTYNNTHKLRSAVTKFSPVVFCCFSMWKCHSCLQV